MMKDMSRNDLSEDDFLFLLHPVTLLAFVTEAEGASPAGLFLTPCSPCSPSLCKGEQTGSPAVS